MEPLGELWKKFKEKYEKCIWKHVNKHCNIEMDLYSVCSNKKSMLLFQKIYPQLPFCEYSMLIKKF